MMVRLGLLLVSLATAADPPLDPLRASFAGTYHYAGDAKEKAARDAALAEATDGIFFLIRGIVGARLDAKTRIAPGMTLTFPPGRVRASFPNGVVVETPDDGSKANVSVEKEAMQASHAFRDDGTLVQTFFATDGSRTNEMSVSEGGKLLHEKVTVKSSKLPHPLVYTLTYAKD
jgi:hypothetical protein